MKKIFLLTTLLLHTLSCARPCPKSIKIDELYFSSKTVTFLPKTDPAQTLIFQNQDGENLVFQNQSQTWKSFIQIDVETLCERGEFLDKSTQTQYFSAPKYQSFYTTTDQEYSLNLQFAIHNAGIYGIVRDTILYEDFTAWGQKVGSTAFVGGFNILSNDRGNTSKIPDHIKNNQNWRYISDTIISGKPLQQLYTNVITQTRNLYIFYSVQNGLEAFTLTNGEAWVRK